jgi:hypothetical protein
MQFHQSPVFPSRCYLEKIFISIFMIANLEPESQPKVIFMDKKYFQKSITMPIFMIITNFLLITRPKKMTP